jgi:hypothetical protein
VKITGAKVQICLMYDDDNVYQMLRVIKLFSASYQQICWMIEIVDLLKSLHC